MATTSPHSSLELPAPGTRSAQSIDDLDSAICRLAARINAESHRLLVLVREFDDRLGWAKWSFRNCAEWLAWRCGMSLSAARERVRTAHALRSLPAISAAFADGRLSYSKVRALTRAAELHDEDLLLAYALEATAAHVEERCRQIRNVAPESRDEANRAWKRRALSIHRNAAAGTMTMTVEIPMEDGEMIANALDRAVNAGEAAIGPEFEANGWQAQQADALVAIARTYLSGGAAREAEGQSGSVSGADHTQVVVHVDETALRGGLGRSDLPIDTMKRLSCDGSTVTVVDDAAGNPLDVGRRKRTVSTALKRALWSRDCGCSFPGCERRHFVDAHHVRHWAEGGETKLENLTLLCSHHHRLVHEGSFRIKRDTAGAIYFARRDGRVIPRQGYRIDDISDDGANASDAPDDVWSNPEARLAELVRANKPSAEVREVSGIYNVLRMRPHAKPASLAMRSLLAQGMHRIDPRRTSGWQPTCE